jgi:hypothetical protein
VSLDTLELLQGNLCHGHWTQHACRSENINAWAMTFKVMVHRPHILTTWLDVSQAPPQLKYFHCLGPPSAISTNHPHFLCHACHQPDVKYGSLCVGSTHHCEIPDIIHSHRPQVPSHVIHLTNSNFIPSSVTHTDCHLDIKLVPQSHTAIPRFDNAGKGTPHVTGLRSHYNLFFHGWDQ